MERLSKIIAVIAVVVVITVVAGPAAIGVVGALAAKALGAGALATAIGTVVGGAITGAIAGAAGTIVANLIDGKDDVFEGVGKSMITGAIGGAFGGLGGLLIKSGMSVGLKLTIDVGMDTIGTVLGDLAVGNPSSTGFHCGRRTGRLGIQRSGQCQIHSRQTQTKERRGGCRWQPHGPNAQGRCQEAGLGRAMESTCGRRDPQNRFRFSGTHRCRWQSTDGSGAQKRCGLARGRWTTDEIRSQGL